ncbi:MAG: lysostaphin resistance A-like protein [Acidimicrobiia bacterium]
MTRSRPATNATKFSVGVVVLAWVIAYVVALVAQSIAIGLAGWAGETSETWPTSVTAAAAVLLWISFFVALTVVSRRFGSGRFAEDFRLAFRPVDLVGLPIGAATQLLAVPALYWPLRRVWPDAFDTDSLSERARDLWDRADGIWVVVLVVVVVIGAPLVEELVYRGLIQQTLQGRLDDMVALVISAAVFAAIHLQAVEFPGLFLFGLVVGFCFMRTGRLGMGIMVHLAFNAAGLLIVA